MNTSDRLWTVEELAEFSRESASVWRKRIFHKDITYLKFGTNVRIPQTALDEWVAARTVKAN